MDVLYIVSIIIGGLFVLLFFSFLIAYARNEAKEKSRMAAIEKMYQSDDLLKMEYDNAVYDDETAALLFGGANFERQVTIDEVLTEKRASVSAQSVEDSVFVKLDAEGIEEITGNYEPEN